MPWFLLLLFAAAAVNRPADEAPVPKPAAAPSSASAPSTSSEGWEYAGCIASTAASGAYTAAEVSAAGGAGWYIPLFALVGGAAGTVYGAFTC